MRSGVDYYYVYTLYNDLKYPCDDMEIDNNKYI